MSHGVEGNGATPLGVAVATLGRWLAVARQREPDAPIVDEAVAWVRAELGECEADAVAAVAGVLDAPSATPVPPPADGATADAVWDVVLVLVWFTAGVVARFGDGDVGWLRGPIADADRDVGPAG